MFKKFSRRFLLITLILFVTVNIVFAYFFFKLTTPNTYNTLSNEQLYDDLTVLIFDEVYSDIKNDVEAQVATENGIEVNDEFTEDIIELLKESILESNLAEIASDVSANNIDNTLSYINGSKDEITFYIPKDDLVIFLEDYYPDLASRILKLAKESEVCDQEGNCLTQQEKDDLSIFIEEELNVEVKQTVEDIKNNEPIFSGDNEISLDEYYEIFAEDGEDKTIEEDLNFFRDAYSIGLFGLTLFMALNAALFAAVMALGPITKLRLSRNIGLISFMSGLLILFPFGITGLTVDDITKNWIKEAPTDFEGRLGEYVVDTIKSLFELLGIIGFVMAVVGSFLLFAVPEMIARKKSENVEVD